MCDKNSPNPIGSDPAVLTLRLLPHVTEESMATSAPQASTSRARTQARKKTNDDAAYFGPSGSAASGSKRQAVDKAEGEPRTKRKRVEAMQSNIRKDILDSDIRKSLASSSVSICCAFHVNLNLARSNSTRCQCTSFNAT